MVLSDAVLFNGKSSKASCIGELKRGDIVTANQLKNRRVRLVEGQKIIGWANLFTKNNQECMLQLEEEGERGIVCCEDLGDPRGSRHSSRSLL